MLERDELHIIVRNVRLFLNCFARNNVLITVYRKFYRTMVT